MCRLYSIVKMLIVLVVLAVALYAEDDNYKIISVFMVDSTSVNEVLDQFTRQCTRFTLDLSNAPVYVIKTDSFVAMISYYDNKVRIKYEHRRINIHSFHRALLSSLK